MVAEDWIGRSRGLWGIVGLRDYHGPAVSFFLKKQHQQNRATNYVDIHIEPRYLRRLGVLKTIWASGAKVGLPTAVRSAICTSRCHSLSFCSNSSHHSLKYVHV